MRYKVWVSIEEIDDEQDHYESVGLPDGLAVFDKLEDAQAFVRGLPGWWRTGETSDQKCENGSCPNCQELDEEALIALAKELFENDEDGRSFDDVPGISRAHDGAWVSVWGWVRYPPSPDRGDSFSVMHKSCGDDCTV